ncbi:MAG: DUF2339 domain-containing protein [bacterium]|nr:DUF2339 domain-containing protein [bacterium]
MARQDSDRVDELEARIAALEARLRELELRETSPAAGASSAPVTPPPPPLPKPGMGGVGPDESTRSAAVPPPLPTGVGAIAGAARESAGQSAARQAPDQSTSPSGRGTGGDLEQFLGLKVLGRLGVAAVVIAAVYFGKLGWDRIGPPGRVLCIYLGAALMLGAGFWLRARGRVRPTYVGLLCGGAVALSYVAGVVAKLGYDLIGGTTALVLLVVSTALGQWLGRLLKLEVIATAALGGGFLAPVLVGDPSESPTALLVYLIVLHTWAAWTEHRWSWHWARGSAVFGTTSILAAWFLANGMPSAWSLVLHVQTALLAVVLPELLGVWRIRVGDARWSAVLGGLWLVQGLLTTVALRHAEVGIYGLVVGVGWLAAGLLLARRDELRHGPDLARLGGVLLVIGAALAWNVPAVDYTDLQQLCDQPWTRTGALLGVAAALFALRRFVRAGDLAIAVAAVLAGGISLGVDGDADRRWLALASLALPTVLLGLGSATVARACGLVVGTVLTFLAPGLVHDFGADVGSWRALAFGVTALWLIAGAIVSVRWNDPMLHSAAATLVALLGIAWIGTAGSTHLASGGLDVLANWRAVAAVAVLAAAGGVGRWRPLPAEPRDLPIVATTGLAIAYLAGLVEVIELVRDWASGWRGAMVSLYSLAFAGALLLGGFVRRISAVRRAGLAGLLLVAAKVALHDLAALDTTLRVLVTGILGVVLILGAWGYARVQRVA